MAVTIEVQADRPETALAVVENWMEGRWGGPCRLLYVEEHPHEAERPQGCAARTFAQLAARPGSPPDPHGDVLTVDGALVSLRLLDRHRAGRPFVQLYLMEVDEEHRGRGLGSRVMQALRRETQSIGADVIVGPITNHDYWERFTWLDPVILPQENPAGAFMISDPDPLTPRHRELIRDW